MRIAIDTGGTFTDCAFVAGGRLEILKVPSTPGEPARAINEVLGKVLQRMSARSGEPGPLDLTCGTTVGTNALLERRGGRVTLVTTRGFEDILEIGRQARPRLYDFFVQRPAPLVPRERRMGLGERIGADGKILARPSRAEIARMVKAVLRSRPQAVAVCLLFSFSNAAHEKVLTTALRRKGLKVSVSHEILPEFREFERTVTTVINAYLVPAMSAYLAGIEQIAEQAWRGNFALRRAVTLAGNEGAIFRALKVAAKAPRRAVEKLKAKHQSVAAARERVAARIMQSNGGIVSAALAAREPVRTILSGPAGGILGAEYVARRAGISRFITFDMGGTSTDVALVGEGLRTTNESQVAGLPVAVPMLEIHTVGAGGGSLARFDSAGALRVGPESAGADPGPICYGRGAQPTVTDAHVILGRLAGGHLLGGEFRLHAQRARKLMNEARGAMKSVEEFSVGIVAVANSIMEKAVRVISVERGYDPRDYCLVAFGGAGGLHACDLAAALDMPAVLIPKFPGGLSALGILGADIVRDVSQTVRLPVEAVAEARRAIERNFRRLEKNGLVEMKREGFAARQVRIERWVDLRYVGQAYALSVPAAGEFVSAFHREHFRRYGYQDASRATEIANVRCRFVAATPKLKWPREKRASSALPEKEATSQCIFGGKELDTAVYTREKLAVGQALRGPAIVREYSATTVVPPGWQGRVDGYENLFLTRAGGKSARAAFKTTK
jgi:N-methylhydantoinase A